MITTDLTHKLSTDQAEDYYDHTEVTCVQFNTPSSGGISCTRGIYLRNGGVRLLPSVRAKRVCVTDACARTSIGLALEPIDIHTLR